MTSVQGTSQPSIVIMAKAPVAGTVKTRLCPPLSLEEAARLAEALLEDTVEAVIASSCARRVIAVDGEPGEWVPPLFEVVPQRGAGLAARLAAAFEDVGGPALAINSDTPQLTGALLDASLDELMAESRDAVLGRTHDGGYWCIGLRRADRRVFRGIPMSTPFTAEAQAERLAALGIRWSELQHLRDVDVLEDALPVALAAPRSRFAATVGALNLPEVEWRR